MTRLTRRRRPHPVDVFCPVSAPGWSLGIRRGAMLMTLPGRTEAEQRAWASRCAVGPGAGQKDAAAAGCPHATTHNHLGRDRYKAVSFAFVPKGPCRIRARPAVAAKGARAWGGVEDGPVIRYPPSRAAQSSKTRAFNGQGPFPCRARPSHQQKVPTNVL